MGWEFRGNRAYYYRKERTGNKVKSVYIGNDEGARIIARVDQLLRIAKREADRAESANPLRPKPKP